MLSTNTQLQPTIVTSNPIQEIAKPAKTFRYDIEVFLKDSNATGNTYFSRYFDWQGICREQWYFQCLPFDLAQSQGLFVTKCAHLDYVHETFPFQKVECRLNAYNIKQCSLGMVFRFYVGETLVCRGYQQLVFVNQNRKITRMPQELIEGIREYEDPGLAHADWLVENRH